MTSFIARVELHDATSADYAKLHEQMRTHGFSTTITSDEGNVYQLPTAEYEYVGATIRADVLEKAKSAAATTGRSAGVLIAQSNGITWTGLPLLRRRAA